MYDNFILAYIYEIRDRVRGLFRDDVDSCNRFEELLREEFLDEYSERITKRSFLSGLNRGLGGRWLLRNCSRSMRSGFLKSLL